MKFSFHLKCLSVLKVIEMIKCEREKIEVETEGDGARGPKDLGLGLDLQRLRRGCVAEYRVNGRGLLAVSCWQLGKLVSLRHEKQPQTT